MRPLLSLQPWASLMRFIIYIRAWLDVNNAVGGEKMEAYHLEALRKQRVLDRQAEALSRIEKQKVYEKSNCCFSNNYYYFYCDLSLRIRLTKQCKQAPVIAHQCTRSDHTRKRKELVKRTKKPMQFAEIYISTYYARETSPANSSRAREI